MTLSVRPFRLASGLVMLAYLFFHLVNHALGAISLGAAETGLRIAKAVWQSWPGTVLLYAAATVHLSLALYTLFERKNWRLPPIEWLRLFAGFSLPTLLIQHAVNTRLGESLYGYDPTYRSVVATIVATGSTGWQFALLAPGWLHGCLGLWIPLRRRAWAHRAKPALLAVVIAMPLLSAYGFAHMHRELEDDPSGGGATYYAPAGPKGEKLIADLKTWGRDLLHLYVVLVAGAVVAGFAYRRLAGTPAPS